MKRKYICPQIQGIEIESVEMCAGSPRWHVDHDNNADHSKTDDPDLGYINEDKGEGGYGEGGYDPWNSSNW